MPGPADPDTDAKARMRQGEARGRQLAERLARLRAGEHATAEDVELAVRAQLESAQRGLEAHARAGSAHRAAAAVHRSAAAVADRSGDQERADFHRAAALADDEAAGLDEQASAPVLEAVEDPDPAV